MGIPLVGAIKDIFDRFLLGRRNHRSSSSKESLLDFVLITVFSYILFFSVYSIDLCGKVWGSKGFSQYQFLFKSRKAVPFFVTALLVALVVWLILQETNWAWHKCFGTAFIKIEVSIKRINFNVQHQKRLRGAWRLAFICLYGVIAIGTFIKLVPHTAVSKSENSQYASMWYEDNVLVAHAGGGNAEGYTYVNSLEAFERNYQLGHRVFEGDLCLTSDGMVVLEHDWNRYCLKLGTEYDGESPTHEQFMNSKFYGTDTPMDITAVMGLMIKYEDMYFMTDYKNAKKDTVILLFQQIVQTAKEMNCENILERFIIQNYNENFKHWVDSVYPFQHWVYTLYKLSETQRTPEKIIRYCEEENIPVITMRVSWINEDWLDLTTPRKMKIFVHTENDPDTANRLIEQGASGIYTDFLRNEQIMAKD